MTKILIVSLLGLVFLVALVKYIIVKIKKNKLKKRILADGVEDYAETAKNIAFSIAKSRKLYKSLIVRVHPDRFIEEKKEIATELSKRLTQAKRNYDELIKIQQDIELFLET